MTHGHNISKYLLCAADCGVHTRQVGEFNFVDNIYCDIELLGSFTLQECADTCANGPYVACDRPIVDANSVVSCYGYFELFEGGCFMRSPNLNFESWLTCPGGPSGAHLLLQNINPSGITSSPKGL